MKYENGRLLVETKNIAYLTYLDKNDKLKYRVFEYNGGYYEDIENSFRYRLKTNKNDKDCYISGQFDLCNVYNDGKSLFEELECKDLSEQTGFLYFFTPNEYEPNYHNYYSKSTSEKFYYSMKSDAEILFDERFKKFSRDISLDNMRKKLEKDDIEISILKGAVNIFNKYSEDLELLEDNNFEK